MSLPSVFPSCVPMEEPDLDVSSIVSEYVTTHYPRPHSQPPIPLLDQLTTQVSPCPPLTPINTPFSSFFDYFASPVIHQPYSTLFGCHSPPEIPRGRSDEAAELLAELREASKGDTEMLTEGVDEGMKPSTPIGEEHSARTQEMITKMNLMISDPNFARAQNCLRAKIYEGFPEEPLLSFLTHCIRWPMRRPQSVLLQATSSPDTIQQVLKTCLDQLMEPHSNDMSRDAHFRVTFTNTVKNLGQLYHIIRSINDEMGSDVSVSYTDVRGRMTFVGVNNNLPIRMLQPMPQFVEKEAEARKIDATYSADFHLCRKDDPRREVTVLYFDNGERKLGMNPTRITEVNIYHIIRPIRKTVSMPSPSCAAKTHSFPIIDNPNSVIPFACLTEQNYSLDDVFQFSTHYNQPMQVVTSEMRKRVLVQKANEV